MATRGSIRLYVVRDMNLHCTVLVWMSNQYSSFFVQPSLHVNQCTKSKTRNCKGPHTINAANVGSTRDLISQKSVYCLSSLNRTCISWLCLSILSILDKLQTKEDQEWGEQWSSFLRVCAKELGPRGMEEVLYHVLYWGAPPRGFNPLRFCIPFWQKRYPIRIPLIEKGAPLTCFYNQPVL